MRPCTELPVANPLFSLPPHQEVLQCRVGGEGGGVERRALEGHRGADYGPRNPFPLTQSLGEAFSMPLPTPPPFRSLQLLPSPRASARCNSPFPVSSISATPCCPAVLHPHLANSSTPWSSPVAQVRVLSRTPSSSPLPPPCAHPWTPAPHASFPDPYPLFLPGL